MAEKDTQILIIDDHDAIRKILGITLDKSYQVITKPDGYEAWAWLAAGNFPALIVLDIQMPRLNGIDFLKQLRASGFFRHIPVIVVSACSIEEMVVETLDLGIEYFMTKPFNPIRLKEKVASILDNAIINI
jgi:DNA-binding response OmpR family regulator